MCAPSTLRIRTLRVLRTHHVDPDRRARCGPLAVDSPRTRTARARAGSCGRELCGAGRALGALEIYVPYASIATLIKESYRTTTTMLFVGLFALWGILATISWSVTRRLRRSASANRRLARNDALTGLANRTAMSETLGRSLANAQPGQPVTVVAMDLDGFAHINEVLGHANGDRYLAYVADQLVGAVGPHDSVARIGGDEFGVVMPITDQSRAEVIQANIRRALLTEFELEAFDADRLALVAELRHSISLGHLVLHYQPKVAASDGHVVGVEALLRWQHPIRGQLLPGAILPAAESTELIVPLTDWVLRDACRQAALWRDPGRSLPIDEIKIDRQFIAPLVAGPEAGHDAAAVVRAVILLGHELDMTVVAEGVKDDATMALLAELGCDLLQGYAITRPAPARSVRALARRAIGPVGGRRRLGSGQLAGVRPRFS